jgi:hypothetical protein
VIDMPESRTGSEIVFESFDLRRGSFRQSFDPPIRKIFHIADNLVASGGTLRKEAIADALNISGNQEAARDSRRMS